MHSGLGQCVLFAFGLLVMLAGDARLADVGDHNSKFPPLLPGKLTICAPYLGQAEVGTKEPFEGQPQAQPDDTNIAVEGCCCVPHLQRHRITVVGATAGAVIKQPPACMQALLRWSQAALK